MQKKLIALAVAGLVSAPAFAQSNVTIYGIADMGYNWSAESDTNSVKSRHGIDSGMQSGSRLGFRGTEDLGNGLKAGFVYEMGFNVDQGTSGQGGRTVGRQAFLSLSGNFGTVALGRQYTPQFSFVSSIDPFGAGTVGDVTYGRGVYTMATGRLVDAVSGGTTAGEVRLDNVVAYVSPNFSGLTVTAAFTNDGFGNEPVDVGGLPRTNQQVWAVTPVYRNGPLVAGLNYHEVSVDSGNVDSEVWDLGASYDFGVVKVAALYGQAKDSIGAQNNKDKKWMLGASAPVGAAGTVLFSYAQVKSSGNVAALDGDKAEKWSLGYTHSLSKRTNLYAVWSELDTNTPAQGEFSVGGVGGALVGDYTRGVNVGVRHAF